MKELECESIGPSVQTDSEELNFYIIFLFLSEVYHIPIPAVPILTSTFVQSTQNLQLLPHRKHGFFFFRKTKRFVVKYINRYLLRDGTKRANAVCDKIQSL